MTTEALPLRPSGLLGTPPSWEVQDAVMRGLSLDLTDDGFMGMAQAVGFTDEGYRARMLESYSVYRFEHQNDGMPF